MLQEKKTYSKKLHLLFLDDLYILNNKSPLGFPSKVEDLIICCIGHANGRVGLPPETCLQRGQLFIIIQDRKSHQDSSPWGLSCGRGLKYWIMQQVPPRVLGNGTNHPSARHWSLPMLASFLTAWVKFIFSLPTFSGNALFNSSVLEVLSFSTPWLCYLISSINPLSRFDI